MKDLDKSQSPPATGETIISHIGTNAQTAVPGDDAGIKAIESINDATAGTAGRIAT